MQNQSSHGENSTLYRWIVVGASTLALFGFEGTLGSFGVFLKPITEELGWTRTLVSGSMSTVVGISGIIGIITGRLTDKYGVRMLIGFGGLLGCLGYLLMYHLNSAWQLYLFFGVMAGVCLGTGLTPSVAIVSRWFTEKRVLAIGITTGGITVGQMILPPLVAYFVTIYGWRPAYNLLAVIIFVVAIPAVVLLGRKPPQNLAPRRERGDKISSSGEVEKVNPTEWSAANAAKTLPLWMLIIAEFVTAAGFYFIVTHIVAYATDLQIAAISAAFILTSVNAGAVVAQLLVWVLAERIGSRFAVVILQALQAFVLFLMIQATSLWMLFALGLVFGFGFGGSTTLRLSMVSEFFGTKAVGAILGITGFAWAVGGIVGPLMAGYIFDLSQSYKMAFLAGGLIMTMGVVAGIFLKAPNASLKPYNNKKMNLRGAL